MKTLTLKRLFVPSLAFSGLVASVMFAAKPAEAASLTYNWSFDGLSSTSGTFVADDATGLLSSIAGTVAGSTISTLYVPGSLGGNDNLTPLTVYGLGFETVDGKLWILAENSQDHSF